MKIRALVVFICIPAAFAVQAQTPAAAPSGGYSLQMSDGYDARRMAVNWETPVLWTHRFGGSSARVELNGEVGVAYWSANGDRQPAHIWQLSAIPMLRYWANDTTPYFLEFGVGPTLFSQTKFADKNVSTAYQFGDYLGVGYQWDKSNRVSLRLAHFSNADIKEPNPGLTMLQLTYTHLL